MGVVLRRLPGVPPDDGRFCGSFPAAVCVRTDFLRHQLQTPDLGVAPALGWHRGAGGLCAHLLPVAGIVSCAVATLNAQIWYRATFSQQYTLDSMPLLWNRGGRAITVLSLLLLGIMASNGMLMGRDGRRIGAGFSPRMTANIAGAEKVALAVQAKEVFNFRLEQGDLLIWAGMKPYVDRRLTLYAQGRSICWSNIASCGRRYFPPTLRIKSTASRSSGRPSSIDSISIRRFRDFPSHHRIT